MEHLDLHSLDQKHVLTVCFQGQTREALSGSLTCVAPLSVVRIPVRHYQAPVGQAVRVQKERGEIQNH
jgi:hypothetical protein